MEMKLDAFHPLNFMIDIKEERRKCLLYFQIQMVVC